MANGILRRVLQAVTWWNGATPGTYFTTFLRGEPVGTDEFGNRYFRTTGGSLRIFVDTLAQAGRRRYVDCIEELARLCRIEHRRLAPANAMGWPAHRGGRIQRHDLSHHQPVE